MEYISECIGLSRSKVSEELLLVREKSNCYSTSHMGDDETGDVFQVEKKLSQMILDKKLSGSLHQDDGVLIVYERQAPDETFEAALSTIHAMGEVSLIAVEHVHVLMV